MLFKEIPRIYRLVQAVNRAIDVVDYWVPRDRIDQSKSKNFKEKQKQTEIIAVIIHSQVVIHHLSLSFEGFHRRGPQAANERKKEPKNKTKKRNPPRRENENNAREKEMRRRRESERHEKSLMIDHACVRLVALVSIDMMSLS